MILRFLRLFQAFCDLELHFQQALDTADQSTVECQNLKAASKNDIVHINSLLEQIRVHVEEISGLREAYQELNTEKLILQDRLDSMSADRSNLWDMVNTAISNERAAYQMHINVEMQKLGGGIPYAGAYSLPPSALPKAVAEDQAVLGRSVLGSHAVKQATSEFINSYVERIKEQTGMGQPTA